MRRRRSSLAHLTAWLAAGLLLAPLSACAALGGGQDQGAARAPMDAPVAGAAPAVEESVSAPGTPAAADTADRSIIRTGEIVLQVADPEDAAGRVSEIATEAGGSVASQSITGGRPAADPQARLTLRVPADALAEVMADLADVGTVTSQQLGADDVTSEHVDLQARVAALEASVDRLRALMGDSASTGELLEAEAALSERQQELDGLRAQLESLEGRITLATVQVTLETRSALPGGGPGTFWEGLVTGVESLGAAGSGALVTLGILLPWLVVAAVVAVAIIVIVRVARKRRRRRIRSQFPPAAEEPVASAETAGR